jgi:hypothetical protein
MHQKFSIMMAIWTVLFCTASIAVTTNSAAREDSAILLKLVSGKAVQGGMLVFQTKAGTKIILDGLELPVSADGLFVLGFHRDDVTPQELLAMDASGKTAKLTLTPEMRDWEIQRIDNLPTNMVTPPEAVITRIKNDIKNVKAARAVISDFDDVLKNGFVWPVWGRISGIYGAQRILKRQAASAPLWDRYCRPFRGCGAGCGRWARNHGDGFIFYRRDGHYRSWLWAELYLFAPQRYVCQAGR